MARPAKQALERIPITLLTGFLGSGKTTLLQGLLSQPEMARTALVVNEFGEISIDHLLLARSSDNIVELANGCLCCEVRHDLVQTLFGLFAGARNGNIPAFDRVIIETTGLAEPASILQMLALEEPVARRYSLNGVVTVVDILNGNATLDRHPTAVNQVATADLIVLTKEDLVDAGSLSRLGERIAQLNPDCERLQVRFGKLPAERILGLAKARGLWTDRLTATPHSHNHALSCSWTFTEAITQGALKRWLDRIRELKGYNLLRLKALLNIEGRPLAVHAAQLFLHPPEILDSWPAGDRRSHIVVILHSDDTRFEEAMQLLQSRVIDSPELECFNTD